MKHNYLISNALFAVFSLLFAANTANADGFSVGASAVRAPVSFEDSGTIVDGDANGWRVFGSYMFNKHFGVEAGMSKFGTPSNSSVPSNMHVDTESYDVYAVVVYPIGNNDASLIAKVGYASWDTETEVNDSNEFHFKNTDLALSFGGQYDFSEQFGVRGEAEWFDSFTSGELKYSLSGVFRFQ